MRKNSAEWIAARSNGEYAELKRTMRKRRRTPISGERFKALMEEADEPDYRTLKFNYFIRVTRELANAVVGRVDVETLKKLQDWRSIIAEGFANYCEEDGVSWSGRAASEAEAELLDFVIRRIEEKSN